MELRIISIGTLPAHSLWGEPAPVRTGHATCSLIRADDRTILIDPGLPPQVMVARLGERAGMGPEDVTHVFLTSFQASTCRGIMAFEDAMWWISQTEREGVGVPLAQGLKKAAADGETQVRQELEFQIGVLRRCEPAPDHLASHVDLFPMPGVTPGLTGLLIAEPRHTTLICGDAVATVEHLEAGRVLAEAGDLDKARESFAEAIEIADLLVLGRDNLVVNPTKRPF